MISSDETSLYTDKSRSQKKRESTALQKMGEELGELSLGNVKKLPLPPDLLEAIVELHAIKGHEARRRQMQFIGRLMREVDDIDTLAQKLHAIKTGKQAESQDFQHIEALRNQLLEPHEPKRIQLTESILTLYPQLDKGKILHLVQGALAEREKKSPPKLFRELFRYLKEQCSQE